MCAANLIGQPRIQVFMHFNNNAILHHTVLCLLEVLVWVVVTRLLFIYPRSVFRYPQTRFASFILFHQDENALLSSYSSDCKALLLNSSHIEHITTRFDLKVIANKNSLPFL
jgi:hypothetical protein